MRAAAGVVLAAVAAAGHGLAHPCPAGPRVQQAASVPQQHERAAASEGDRC